MVSDQDWLRLCDQLFAAPSHEEKTMGAMVLSYRPAVRAKVSPARLRRWLLQLSGWAEVDALCYNIFTADELVADWPRWKAFLSACARSKNRNVRRAALVLLCGPVARTADQRVHQYALALIEQQAGESAILITKAMSWLLRCQADTQPDLVSQFLATHEQTLPRFVVREVTRKLTAGRKNR
jgi:3-methyladenine DNA glycosylase AlkD